MCTRYTLTSVPALIELCAALGLIADPEDFAPGFNVAPTHQRPVVVSRGRPELTTLSFGFVLPPRPPAKRGLMVVTARSETLRERPAFRDSTEHRRCLIPADGFFEWEKDGKARRPHYLYLKDRRPFFLAGLWQPGTEIAPASFVVVTTAPNDLIRPFHDRMPVILGPNSGPAWLGSEPLEPTQLARLCRPLPADMMATHRVDPQVNSVRYEAHDSTAALPADSHR